MILPPKRCTSFSTQNIGMQRNNIALSPLSRSSPVGRGGIASDDGEGFVEKGVIHIKSIVRKKYDLLENARALRREMTPQEKHLWYDYLRFYPVKIYKQRIIDNFVVDFYCAKARLIIELDGSQHYTPDGKNIIAFVQRF